MPNNTYPSKECAALPICNISSEPFADRDKIVLILKQGIFEAHLPRVRALESKFNLKQYIDDRCVHHMIDHHTILYTHTLSNENTPVVAQTHPTFLKLHALQEIV